MNILKTHNLPMSQTSSKEFVSKPLVDQNLSEEEGRVARGRWPKEGDIENSRKQTQELKRSKTKNSAV